MIPENSLLTSFYKDIQFSDIFDLDEVQRMQDLFSEATGVASMITNPDGIPLTRPSNFCRFCRMVRDTEKGSARCIESDRTLGVNDPVSSAMVLRSCLNVGLWDSGASLIVEGKLLANWLIGQVRNEPMNESQIRNFANEIGVDDNELINAFYEIPVMQAHKFEKITEMLFVFVNELTQKAYSNLQLKIEIEERKKANALLLKSEEKYRTIFETIHDVFYQIDLNGIITEISPSISLYTSFEREAIIGRSVSEFYVSSVDREIFLQEVKTKKEIRDYELDINAGDVGILNVSINARLVHNSEGNPVCVEGVLRDVTKRKNAEKALRESELKFRNYIDFAPHAVFVANETGKYIDANPAALRMLGYTMEELFLINPAELVSADSREQFSKHFEIAKGTGYASDEITVVRKDKEAKKVVVDTVRLSEQCYLGFVVDITDRKTAEEVLKESEMHLTEVQNIAHLGNVSIDVVTRNWKSSEVLNRIFGITEHYDFSYAGWKKIIHPDSEREILDYLSANIIHESNLFDKKFRIIRQSDREIRWVHVIGKLKFDTYNQPVKLIATIQDITERQQSTEALRQSEALYRTTLNASPDTIVIVEMDGSIRMVSPSGLILFGYDDESMVIGHNMFEYIESEDVERAQSNTMLMYQGYLGTIQYQ
ncbi:MAG TPA: PAS domain S-box protein, partial [Paludibacter sp.]